MAVFIDLWPSYSPLNSAMLRCSSEVTLILLVYYTTTKRAFIYIFVRPMFPTTSEATFRLQLLKLRHSGKTRKIWPIFTCNLTKQASFGKGCPLLSTSLLSFDIFGNWKMIKQNNHYIKSILSSTSSQS